MIDSSLYLVGIRKDTGEYEEKANSCQLCRKIIINAGIKEVIVKDNNKKGYELINVEEWIENDDLLERKDNILRERRKLMSKPIVAIVGRPNVRQINIF